MGRNGRSPRISRLGLPRLFAVADADEFGFFFLFRLFEERSKALGAKAELLFHAGMRIVGILEFLEEEQDVELSISELDFGIVVDGELRIRATSAQRAHGVDLILLRQLFVEVEDPGIESVVDANDLLAGFEHGFDIAS